MSLSARLANLSPEKRQLLMQRLQLGQQSERSPQRQIQPQHPRPDFIPLSFNQQRLWFLDELQPGSASYNSPIAIEIVGNLDVPIVQRSVAAILRRHEVLRTYFVETAEGKPTQAIAPELAMPCVAIDLADLSEGQQEVALERLTAEFAQHPFQLDRQPPLRTAILLLGSQRYILLATVHHILADGWSVGILLQEFHAFYTAFSTGRPAPLPELPIQSADYAIWQRQWLQGERFAHQLEFWKQQMAGERPALQLPTDRPRPAVQSFAGAKYRLALPDALYEELKNLSKAENCTLFVTLLAAFKTLLYRYTGQGDITIGTAMVNRDRPQLKSAIGFFANTVLLRSTLQDNPPFKTLLQRVSQTTVAALSHQELPFDVLVKTLQPDRDLSRNPLFQVWFALHQTPMQKSLELSGLQLCPLPVSHSTCRVDLSLDMAEIDAQLTCVLEYSTDLFDTATIADFAKHFQTILTDIVAHPTRRLSELVLLAESDIDPILQTSRAPALPVHPDVCLHQLFEQQVQQTPDAIAIVDAEGSLTYRELDKRANRVARQLRRLGAGSDRLIALCTDRSAAMPVGMLAILKAGAAYVPIDPAYPSQRMALMLQDSGAAVAIAQSHLQGALPEHEAQVVLLDRDFEGLDAGATAGDDLLPMVYPQQLAYQIYTSGSTATPKGVQISHAAVVNFLAAMRQAPGLEPSDILLAVTTSSFDIAVLEIFLPLIVGARVAIASREAAADALQLAQLMRSSGATAMQATPVTWQMLLDSGWTGDAQLKVLCGGEALPLPLAQALSRSCGEVWNLYGPTEATVWTAVDRVAPDAAAVSLGRAIGNTQLYVLDCYSHLVPANVPGELHVGGAGLARGYFKRPDLTAERFCPDPFSSQAGARLYKTGDLVRYRRDGSLEFLGRIDNQIKLRGFRIELGEIESCLLEASAVRAAVAIVREDRAGDKRLVAYVIPQDEPPANAVDRSKVWRQLLQAKLPAYMVPHAFVVLETFPLTPNGKIDRKALPAPEGSPESAIAFEPPQTPVQERLCGIWADVLDRDRVGIGDNFFELGGDSILAMQAIAKAKQAGLPLTPKDLFQNQTIAELAATASAKAGRERLQQEAQSTHLQAEWETYWQAIATADLTHLPTDCSTTASTIAKPETVSVSLSNAETRSLLEALPALYNASLTDAVLSALATACCDPKQSLLLQVDGNGGDFTSSFPLLLPNGDRQSPGTTLKRIKEAVRQVPNGGVGCDLLQGSSDSEGRSHWPAAAIAFSYCEPLSGGTSHGSPALKQSLSPDSMQTDRPEKLAVTAHLDNSSLCLHWHYSPDLHRQGTVTQLAQQTLQALQDLADHCQAPNAGGYTPSDFPLAQLDTPTLHKLFGRSRAIADLYPLSPIQAGLLFHTLYSPEAGLYFDQMSCKITGALNIHNFQQAWAAAIERHGVLRTAFLWQELDRPLQAVHHEVPLPWIELDWRDFETEVQAERLEAFLLAERERGFDLGRPPLMRLTLIHLDPETYYFVWSRHHLLLDGWSLPLVVQAVLSAYGSLSAGKAEIPLPASPPYRDYIVWLQSQSLDEAKTFWQEYLAGWTQPLAIDRLGHQAGLASSSKSESHYAECNIPFTVESSAQLDAWVRQHRLTLNTLIQGLWSLLLAHYSGELDIVFGATVAGRPTDLEGVEATVGLFINTLPVRVRVDGRADLLTWLQQLQAAQVEVNRYAYSPLTEVQSWSNVPRGRALFESIVVFENYPIDAALEQQVANLSLQGLGNEIDNGYPLTLRGVPKQELLLQLIYDRDRLDLASVEPMGEHLRALLKRAVEQPEIQVGELQKLLQTSSQQSFKQVRRQKLGQIRRQAIRRSAAAYLGGEDR
ncbi:non-ribosomal peptide synthetase [Synechococcus sp. PCC 7336]|uniref:non-ribosomal peptide synthetase n=1 Tax=Synechococcus sp. PCC 7336 TaxID=195250 RepID=UPI00034A32AD|nr:non-ribosomal peptide synthetase [Synechococcus sp. PCC 7336]